MPTRLSPEPGPDPEDQNQKLGLTDNTVKPDAKTDAKYNGSPTPDPEKAIEYQISSPFGSRGRLWSGDFALSRDVSTALTYGLELVRYGAMLVAVEGTLHLANRAALAILDKKDGLLLAETRVIADRASDTRLLLRLLQEAVQYPQRGEPCESPLTLPRKAARSSLVVRVVPGPGLECWNREDNRAAMMMLYDQDVGPQVNVSLLTKLYGLTRGEASLAATLIKGKSIEEAAEELFISPHTARTHLKRIFMKTDTHRQTELVVKTFPAVL